MPFENEVTSCSSEQTNCPALEALAAGLKLLVEDPSTHCAFPLAGSGIPVQTSGGVAIKDGSNAKPIILPNVTKDNHDTTFTYLPFFTAEGRLKFLKAGTGDFMLTARKGSFGLRESHPLTCVDPALICNNCEAQEVAIWHENNGKLCLGRMSLTDLIAEFENVHQDTNSIDFQGSGSSETPWVAHVNLSEAAGNIIEILGDGLFADIPISAEAGNILEMLPDGLFVPTPTS
jgi:hypothetical protein